MTRYWLSMAIALSTVYAAGVHIPQPDGDMTKSTKPPYDQRNHHAMGGTVTSVSKNAITVKNAEVVDGTQNPPVFIVSTLTLQVSEVLANGKVARDAVSGETYRLTDLKIGDKVDLQYNRTNGIYTCTTICITRRPGGRVPPAQDLPKESWESVHHDRMNALQDWEERGILIPERYDAVKMLAKIRAEKIGPELRIP